jgi:hypothetical protein
MTFYIGEKGRSHDILHRREGEISKSEASGMQDITWQDTKERSCPFDSDL